MSFVQTEAIAKNHLDYLNKTIIDYENNILTGNVPKNFICYKSVEYYHSILTDSIKQLESIHYRIKVFNECNNKST